RDNIALDVAGDDKVPDAEVDVHFATDPDVGEVDPGLDREAGAGDEDALVVGLVVVQVGAFAVDVFPDVVPGAMDVGVAESGGVDDVAGGVVHFPPLEDAAGQHRFADDGDGRVARRGDDAKNLPGTIGDGVADEAHPGVVGVDGVPVGG